ncbi:MAG: glycosyltransferase family 2 protein, partial [Ignavibacteria bacterium]|nr:glycosyltransferase family 2 protein [Ignavibacteria bacterium]
IIIVNYNLTENIRNLLTTIDQNVKDIDYEVIVVDNNSPDRSVEKLTSEFPQFRFEFLNTNYGFGHGNNVGASKTSGKYLLLLNPDTFLVDNLPLKLYNFAEKHNGFGIIAPQMDYPDGTFQISYAKFPNLKQEIAKFFGIIRPLLIMLHKFKCKFNSKNYFEVDFVFGSCMFIRREIFDEVEGFDEKYFLLTEEVDLCYRVRQKTKYRIIYWQGAKIVHLKSQITGKDVTTRFKQEYFSKWRFFNKHYSFIRVFVLRLFIVIIFSLKYLAHTLKKERKQKIKGVYLYIIKLYLNLSSEKI